jgi:hypothetical protein
VAQADLLRDVLELAGKEKSLEGEGLEAFAAALRERAALILADRVRPLEEENAWQRDAVAGLEKSVRALEAESAWRRETVAGLQEAVRALQEENRWQRETVSNLQESVRSLEAEKERLRRSVELATGAHDLLLAHHRDVLRQVMTEALAVSALSVLQVRQARQRLRALAALLRPEAAAP